MRIISLRGWLQWFAAVTLVGSSSVSAQEALRSSLATEAARRAQREAQEIRYYNLKMGPVSMRFQSSASVEFTDNVNLSNEDPESDVILRPQLNTSTWWQVTEQNDLTLNLGIGYEKHFQNTALDNLFITPGSDLSFDIFIGSVIVNLHDRFSLSQEAYTQPSVSGTARFGRFENTIGVQVIWDLNKIVQTFNYDHHTYISTEKETEYLDRSSELFSAQTAYVINSKSQAGLNVGATITSYEQDVLRDLTSFNAGPFFASQLTPYLNLRVYAGYTTYFIDVPENFPGEDTVSAIYSDIRVSHRVNNKISYSASIGRQIQLGIFSDTLDVYFARLSVNWRLLRKVQVITPVFFESAEESGNSPEKFDRIGAGIEARYQITRKLSSSTSYYFTKKTSNISLNDYLQNRLVLNLGYRF